MSGDVLTIIYDMTKVGGLIETQLDSTEEAIAEREDKLKELEQLMTEVYDRYIKQFSVMESAVTEMNSIRENTTNLRIPIQQ